MTAPRPERRLVAILAADIVGYSRLVERDEGGTLAAIRDLRARILDPLLAEHQGRIVKLMGDGAIVEFGSVVDAVAYAVAVQKAVAADQTRLPSDRRLVFRIGVNLGDVVVDGDDLLGDGVNVAARLEQLCEPGGVLVSGTAFDQLQGKLGLPLDYTGEQRVKNISRPVRSYRVRLDGKAARRPVVHVPRRALAALVALVLVVTGLVAWRLWPPSSGVSSRPVVAVMPFAVPAGSDPRLIELADSLAIGIMDELSISRIYVVMGRSASFAYRDTPNPAQALGKEQGATFVVEGALQQSGQSLRASAQLVDALTGEQLWSERFDRPAADWDVVRDELGARIGNAVNASAIRPAIRDRAMRRPVQDLAAYELALLAGDRLEDYSKEANAKGLELTDLALQRDPRSSAALVYRAWLLQQQIEEGYGSPPEALRLWGETVRALSDLDPNYAWGRLFLASWGAHANRSHAEVLAELDRAVELAPNNPGLLSEVAELLPWQGQTERARQLLDRAGQLDPELRFNWRYYIVDFFDEQFRDAVDVIDGLTTTGRWEHVFATLAEAQLGDAEASSIWRKRLAESWPDYSWELAASQAGDFAPSAQAGRTLWRQAHHRASLALCASPQDVVRLAIRRLPECDAERAKATPASASG
ncbi:MAG: adenylate/guanylate cyclase domain-containing protein [Geminicoccaceae bacterium]